MPDPARRPADSTPSEPGTLLPAAATARENLPPLPLALTRLVGRDRLTAHVAQLIARHRLVTLTGMGGVGKTRVALAVAERIRSSGRAIVWVDVSSLPAEPSGGAARDVADAVAAVICGDDEPHRPTTERLTRELAGSDALVVLDGCERVRLGCRNVVELLLGACPRVALLVTTRELLGVPGELTWPVPPLPVDAETADGRATERDDAVRLFLDRALEAQPSLPQDPHALTMMTQICRRLEGLPLAIALAAARLRVLSLAQIAAGLDDCCRLLAAPGDALPPRHRTLQANLDLSHDLLPDVEAAVFRRLAVLPGGARLAAVQAVAGPDVDVLNPLTRLAERSLVAVHQDGDQTRFRLPEAVRQYAWARLDAAGEAGVLQERLVDWCLSLLDAGEPGTASPAWLDAVEAELANLRHAVAWACRHGPEAAVRLTARLWPFWRARGRYAEGRSWIVRALDAVDPAGRTIAERTTGHPLDLTPVAARDVARAQHGAGVLAFLQCDYVEALRRLDGALALYPPDDDGVWEVARTRASIAREQGEYERAAELMSMVERAATERSDHATLARCVLFSAFNAWLAGDLAAAAERAGEAARLAIGDHEATIEADLVRGLVLGTRDETGIATALLEGALAAGRRHGLPEIIAYALHALGTLARRRGDPASAIAVLRQALAIHHELGDRWRCASVVDDLAWCAHAGGRDADAAVLLGAADTVRQAIDVPVPAVERAARTAVVDDVRAALGPDAYESALHAGSLMGLDGAVDHVNHALPARALRAVHVAEPGLLVVTALGTAAVRLDGRPLSGRDWGYAKPRELLYFLLSSTPATKAEIGLALWPEADAVALRGAFHTTLNRLRRAIGPDRVLFSDRRYTTDRSLPLTYDVDTFRSAVRHAADSSDPLAGEAGLRAAIDAYAGDYLVGEPFGDWVAEVRRELRVEAERAMLDLARRMLQRGDPATAVPIFERALALDPLLESAHRGVMHCQALLGEPVRALRHYAVLRTTLRRELDTDPAPATTALARRIRAATTAS